jgi:hypothetical protein
MTEIDRRALITVAGVGLLAAGCREDKPAAAAIAPSATPTPGSQAGTCDLFGQAVSATKPIKMGKVTEFKPDKICIVLLRFETAGSLVARRSYIPYEEDQTTRVQNIEDEIKKLSTGKSTSYYKQDIEPINLKGQRLLVIYVDHKDEEAHFKLGSATGVTKYDNTLRFTKFSGTSLGNTIWENHAFFNAKEISFPNLDPNALSLEYWDTDENGDAAPGTVHRPYCYSLNIQLEVASPSVDENKKPITRWVPVIVDPDTGNMGVEP